MSDTSETKTTCSGCMYDSSMCETHRNEAKERGDTAKRFAEQTVEMLRETLGHFAKRKDVDLATVWLGMADAALRGGSGAGQAVKAADEVIEAYRGRATGLGETQK